MLLLVKLQCSGESERKHLDTFKGVITTLINAATYEMGEKLNIDGELDKIDDHCSVSITPVEN